MEIYALVGSSGTGKSHRAAVVANQVGADAIIDDGLLIRGNIIVLGSSAKRQPTIIDAIKAALFMHENQAKEMKQAILETAPNRILILGTSVRMVERITDHLELPRPQKIMYIEDFASEKEIRKAKYLRTHFAKHVVPAPTMEVKKSLPVTLIDSFNIFLKKKEATGKKEWMEQSIIRPTFTINGKLIIADSAISAIANHAAHLVKGVTSVGRVAVNVENHGVIIIHISPTIVYGLPLHKVAIKLQSRVAVAVEKMTGLQVKKVNVLVKGLSFPQAKA